MKASYLGEAFRHFCSSIDDAPRKRPKPVFHCGGIGFRSKNNIGLVPFLGLLESPGFILGVSLL